MCAVGIASGLVKFSVFTDFSIPVQNGGRIQNALKEEKKNIESDEKPPGAFNLACILDFLIPTSYYLLLTSWSHMGK